MENSVIDLLFAKSHQHCLKTCPKHLCLLTPKQKKCLLIPCYPPHALAPLSSWAGSRQEPGALVMSKCLKIPLSTHTCFSQTKAPSFPHAQAFQLESQALCCASELMAWISSQKLLVPCPGCFCFVCFSGNDNGEAQSPCSAQLAPLLSPFPITPPKQPLLTECLPASCGLSFILLTKVLESSLENSDISVVDFVS